MTAEVFAVLRRGLLSAFLTLLLAAGIALVLPPTLIAQETAPVEEDNHAEDEVPEEVFAAPVVIDGETLFLVRGSTALPANERAAKIEERIVALAEGSADLPIEYDIRDNEFGQGILANGRILTVTTAADADFEQMELEVLASLQAQAIEKSVTAYRDGRSSELRVDSALAAVGWTAFFAIVTLLFFRRRKRIILAVRRLTEARFVHVEAATRSMVQGKAVGRLASYVANILMSVTYLFLLYYYLSFVLLAFPESRSFAQLLLTYVSEPLVNVILGFVAYLPNLIILVIAILVTRYVIAGLRLLMDNIAAGTIEIPNFEPHWITPTFNIGRILIIAIAVVFAYPYIPGSDSRAFQGLTIIAGIMVSLGSNAVVSNMMAGLFVIYRRSTNIGDRIKVGDQVGDVVEIRLMETLIKSIKNEMISIPNAQLLNSEVVNYSRTVDGRGLMVHTTVGIGYDEPQEKVEAMLIEAARRTKGLRRSQDPFVLWTALDDYAINYQINAFTKRGATIPQILSDLHRNIVAVFHENDVQIMTPSYEGDPDAPKIPTAEWDGQLARHVERPRKA